MAQENLKTSLGKLADPLAAIGIIVGVFSWIFTSYNKIENNSESINIIRDSLSVYKLEADNASTNTQERLSLQGEKLSKIEGKLDMIIDIINTRRGRKRGD